MGKIIGIDLGTTNSCMAVVEGGKPTIIANAEGLRTTPSVVAFTNKGERLIGNSAKRQAVTNPTNTFMSIKRHMGSDYKVDVYGKEYTPQEISAMILKKLKKDAEIYLGEEVNEAVITVPAYFNDAQRQATKDAGKIAGLKVMRIVNEPTSAALAYGLDNEEAQKIVVYDLGGGTFDVSIIDIGDGIIEVLSTNGDTHLGGDDFDEILINWIITKCKKEFDVDLTTDRMALQRIREEAEKTKIELSSSMQANINLPFIASSKEGTPLHIDFELSRAEFENMIMPLINKTMKPVENALKDAGLKASDIDKVLLVGGSTRIPAVQRKVADLIGKEPNKGLNPDECVALGAAIQGGKLSKDEDSATDLLLLDVTPLSLSIETVGGISSVLIERNTSIPIRKTQVFSTAADNQTSVEIHVLQGERQFAKDNKTLGRFILDGIPKAKKGEPQISVTFDIDANGIVNVSAMDMSTGCEQHITIQASTNMSSDDIDDAIMDATRYEEEDRKRRDRIETYNECTLFINQVEKNINDKNTLIEEDDKNDIVERLEKMKGYMKTDAENLDDYSLEQIVRLKHDILERTFKVSDKMYSK